MDQLPLAALVAGAVSLLVALVGHVVAYRSQRAQFLQAVQLLEQKLRHDAELQRVQQSHAHKIQQERLRQELRTEYMAEQAIIRLLSVEHWKQRSFSELSRRIGGFEENQLRRLLVRSGALRFKDDEGPEFWGLLHRNEDRIAMPARESPDAAQ